MAYKVFSNGDALTGSELNTYLMNQSVMVFASTTARDAALTAPTEGMVVWLQDANKYVYYTGSAWADLITPASSGNAIINGAFEINQRNFSSTASNTVYTFDRWKTNYSGGTVTYSSQAFTPGAAPAAGYEAANFVRISVSGQTTSSQYASLNQPIEDVRSFAGQTVTLSFWAKAASGTPKVAAYVGQWFGSGGSSTVYTYATAVTVSTSWARYSITFAVPSISGKTIGAGSSIELGISASDGYNANLGFQNATIDLWGTQLEAGSVATPFKRNAPSIQAELAACQRYAIVYSGDNTVGTAPASSTTAVPRINIATPSTMRGTPTMTISGTLQVFDGVTATNVTSLGTIYQSQNNIQVQANVASGLTQYRTYNLFMNSGSLTISAEL